MARVRRTAALSLLALVCVAILLLAHIGYFGGPIFYEIPAKAAPSIAPPRTVAVVLSGDMGFHVGMAPKIADRLAAHGVPVLGVSSLEFFRRRRTPEEIRAFIADAAHRALRFAHADNLILIGQSFGADMLQFGGGGLSVDVRDKVRLIALVVPGDTVTFRASPAELFDWATPDAPALPTTRLLDWAPGLCVHGVDEDNSLCPLLTQPNMRTVALPGGHLLDRDVDRLYATLATAITAVDPPGRHRASAAAAMPPPNGSASPRAPEG